MTDDFGFAPPPFQPDTALQRLRREWRELGLAEREGIFERQGMAWAACEIDADAPSPTLKVRLVTRPSRLSPVWQTHAVKDHAALRQIQTELRKRLSAWTDRDD